jgi:hypothetical protein
MKIFISAFCALCLVAIPALAAPACVTGSYASYQALAGGCTIDNATFSNFSGLSFVNSPGVPPLTASEIEVIPSSTPTTDVLTFVFLNAAGAPTPVTVNQNGQIFSFGLNFQIAVTPGSLTGIQMGSTFSNTAPGSVSASKSVQPLIGGPSVSSTVNDGGVSNAMATYNGLLMPVSGVGPFLVTDTTSLQAQTGSVTEAGFANSFNVGGVGTPTPEIASLAMIGSGLVFLSLIASSTRKRRRAKS